MKGNFDNRRIAINMVFSVIAFVLNTLVSFFITPYITSQFGSEAYGFIKLSTDFTSYAALVTLALNSMSSRFIMLERERNNVRGANEYYSSLMLANVGLTLFMGILSLITVFNLEKIVSIPEGMTAEVKLVFAITFLSFLISLATSIYGNCFYLSNRLDLNSIRTAESTIIRVVTIIGLFLLFEPKISYVALGSLVSTVYLCVCNFIFSGKLLPDLKVKRKYFKFERIKELFFSGIWNSITKLSQILSSGLDLLMTNIMINSQMMGYLSVAKTVPTLVASFNSTIANVFSPNLMMLYAKDDIEGLKKATKTAMKFMCLFVSIPNAILITMGKEFFDLWVPGQPSKMINILSVLTIINSVITGPTQPLYQIFTITNKIKQSSIVMIIYGAVSVLMTYVCLQVTDLGVYAVAGVSLIGSLIVALFYHIPYAAKYIGLPKRTFFPEIGISILSTAILCGVGLIINYFMELNSSWVMWFTGACLTGIIGLFINVMIILNKEERKKLWNRLFSKVGRRKG